MDGVKTLLRRHGRQARLVSGGTETAGLAMVQPLLDRDDQWIPTPLGRMRGDRFLYIGEPALPVDELGEAGYVVWEGQAYEVVTAQPVRLGGKLLYRWAVLTVREEKA